MSLHGVEGMKQSAYFSFTLEVEMDLDTFHNIFRDYLRNKSMDVKLITALDRTLENWFQGEMALAFAELGTKYKIISTTGRAGGMRKAPKRGH